MWYAVLDGDPVFWTFGKSQKIRNLERAPGITCLVESGEEYAELQGVEIVGRGTVVREHDEIMAIGEAVYARYFGEVTDEIRPFVHQSGAKRLGVRISTDRIVSWDHRKLEGRSEEHTSELQSLMRISYAVFCLKKKKNN